jgi:hypothetical protein
MANPDVAADVSPLIIPGGEKFEPTRVGCYGVPNSAGQRVAPARRTKLGDDGIWAHSAIRNPNFALERLFSWILFGMDDCRNEFCLDARPHLLSSPPGEEIPAGRFWFGGRLSGKSSRANFQKSGERFSFSLGRRPG